MLCYVKLLLFAIVYDDDHINYVEYSCEEEYKKIANTL